MNELIINYLQPEKYEDWKSLIDNMNGITIDKVNDKTGNVTATITYYEMYVAVSIRQTFDSTIIEFVSDDMITMLECNPNQYGSIVLS